MVHKTAARATRAKQSALHYMHYNFCRIHKTLRVTPTMAAGVTDHLWEIGDIVRITNEHQASQKAKGGLDAQGARLSAEGG